MFRRLLSHMPLVLFALAWLAIAYVLGHLATVKQLWPATYIEGVIKWVDVIKDHFTSKHSWWCNLTSGNSLTLGT